MIRRRHLFEWGDQHWFPLRLRAAMTDYLRFMFQLVNFYQPVVPLIANGIKLTAAVQVVDLCSGGGGPVRQFQSGVQVNLGRIIPIVLTDKFPNIEAFRYLSAANSNISFSPISIDAVAVPASLSGFRTLFSGIHHFNPDGVRDILQHAVKERAGIALVDGNRTNVWLMLLINLFQPLLVLLVTPFITPFRWSRLLFTYLLPLIPFCVAWDGMVSICRLYRHEELLRIAKSTSGGSYHWQSGKIKNELGVHVAYLIGVPANHTF